MQRLASLRQVDRSARADCGPEASRTDNRRAEVGVTSGNGQCRAGWNVGAVAIVLKKSFFADD